MLGAGGLQRGDFLGRVRTSGGAPPRPTGQRQLVGPSRNRRTLVLQGPVGQRLFEVEAGSEDLQKVDVDEVFGPSFTVALHSVAEVGTGRKAKESPSRLAEVQRVYDRRLAEHTDQ